MKKILQKDEKPFDELLNDFVEGETKDEDPSTGSGQDENEDEDDWEWDDYPDGEVELNDHAKIQLRILYPEPHPLQALERLEGCADIKARIDELVALTAFNRLCQLADQDFGALIIVCRFAALQRCSRLVPRLQDVFTRNPDPVHKNFCLFRQFPKLFHSVVQPLSSGLPFT